MLLGYYSAFVRMIDSKMLKYIVLLFIRGYQLMISPFLPSVCRYTPTCSQYAILAINKYGIIKGLRLAISRVLRCHPWGSNGHDPVP